MKKYKLYLDLGLIIRRLKKVKLEEYNSNNPIVFIDANDPDEACNKCFCNLSEKIMKSKRLTEAEMIELTNDLLHDMRIMKVMNR